MEIGLFFGSFNPIHIGHLIIAETMIAKAQLDKVWFIVSPQNPFKKKSNLAHEFDRYDMVRLAIQDNPRFDVSDIEFKLPKPSFTAVTLAELSNKHPEHRFQLIIGGDNLSSFHKWKNYESILENHHLLVYPRPTATNQPEIPSEKFTLVESPMMDISATFIRKAIKEGHSVKYLITEEVAVFIANKKLFI